MSSPELRQNDPYDPIIRSPPADHRLSINDNNNIQSPTKDLNESIREANPALNQTVTTPGVASKSLLIQPGQGAQGQMLNRPELRLESQINFMISLISGVTILIIWWNLIFVEAFCLLRFACIPDGVETPMLVMKSMFVIFFFVLLFAPTINYVVRHGDKSGVRCFKYINWLLILAMIILFIVAFAQMGSFGSNDIVEKWSQLSTADRLKYDNDISKLVDINKKNLLLHAIYNIVLTILFVVITIALYNYDFILPERWASDRARKSRVSFAEDSLIVVSKNKPESPYKAQRFRSDITRGLPMELPPIDEERHSLVADSVRRVDLFPSSGYDNYPARDRTFASPDAKRREMDNSNMRSPPAYGTNTVDRNDPRSPQGVTRGGYDDLSLRTRDIGRSENNANPPPGDIEMTTSNYVGNLTRKKRTIGE